MPDSDHDASNVASHAATDRYLSMISAVGECLAAACPPVGGPYRHQFTRMRTRLAFDPNPESVDESFRLVAEGLQQYSLKASEYLKKHQSELSGAMSTLREIGQTLSRRQEFHYTRLRKCAEQLEGTDEAGRGIVPLSASIESFSHESQSLITRLFDEIAAIEKRVAESETADLLTNLTNRREMERQIETRRAANEELTLLRYSTLQPVPDEVAKEIAVRLTAQFRPHDIISRWSPTEFLVLFLGPVEVAEMRVHQVTPWLAGRYPLDNGGAFDVQMESEIFDSALVSA